MNDEYIERTAAQLIAAIEIEQSRIEEVAELHTDICTAIFLQSKKLTLAQVVLHLYTGAPLSSGDPSFRR